MITYNPELFVRNVKGLVRFPNCQLGNLPQLPEASGMGNLTITGLATGMANKGDKGKGGKHKIQEKFLKS